MCASECMSVHHMWGRIPKRSEQVQDPLEPALGTVARHHVGAGNKITVLCKNSECSYLLGHLLSSCFFILLFV